MILSPPESTDLIALGRQLLADPDIAIKGQTGRAADRKCLRCGTCQSPSHLGGPPCGQSGDCWSMRSNFIRRSRRRKGFNCRRQSGWVTPPRLGHEVTLYEALLIWGAPLLGERHII